MAKIQNTFIKSKMNKDLDDRLITNGEYRNAVNVNVSRSESSDVGALENVLGNEFVENFQKNSKLSINEVIGVHIDEVNEIIYAFSTDYSDNSSNNLSNKAPYNATCLITSYNIQTKTFGVLVSGSFLNFSKTHPILNVDLIENLLFFTDNRNQPRKINVEILPNSNYYTTEDQISVAKYYPYVAPNLYNSLRLTDTKCSSITGELPTVGLCESSTTTPLDVTNVKVGMQIVLSDLNLSGTSQGGNIYISSIGVNSFQVTSIRPNDINWSEQSIELFAATSTDVSSQFLAPYFIGLTKTSSATNTIIVNNTYANQNVIKVGDLVSQSGIPNLTTVDVVSQGNNQTTLTLQNTELTGDLDDYLTPFKTADQFVLISSPNPDYDKNWPGDSEFLKDKFVRFAYRYKFDDGEYSLISPFTQPAFIPKQDGYFTPGIGGVQNSNKVLLPQETTTMGSTIVSFMENKVDNVKINIPTPYPVNELQQKLKVSEIDILYKESDGLAIKVLESVPIEDASAQTGYTYTYDYQSRKPYKVLPEKEVSRVYDQVPIRALTQSISGNRVIYGNFIDRHTSPKNLNFSVVASEKTNVWKDSSSYSTISYPNHTLKQNRIYQVGIVLADRYGRQSDVVLSSIGNSTVNFPVGTDTFFSGSTLYHPYRGTGLSPSNIQNWFGDSLKILFEGTVPKTRTDVPGYPGLYKSGKIEVNVRNSLSNVTIQDATDIVFEGRIEEVEVGDLVVGVDNSGVSFEAYVIIGATTTNANNETIITVEGSYTLTVGKPITIIGRSNDLGWYSYKIVVKQTSQEYYNIYAPSIVAGDLSINSDNSQNTVSTVTLISDNVNKLPSDLQDVQPQQTQFRTSDSIIYPRVGGKVISSATYFPSYQSFLGRNYFTIDTMGKAQDMGFSTSSSPTKGIFNVQSNPPIARITTEGSSFGNLQTEDLFINSQTDYTNFNDNTENYTFPLTVLEVKPRESLLDIFWETSTSGLISELNNSTLNFTNLGVPFELRVENDIPGNAAFDWQESDAILDSQNIITNSEQQIIVGDGKKIVDRVYVVDQQQGAMGAAIIELTSVKRNGVPQTLSDFSLIPNPNTNGEFYLTVKRVYSFRAVAGSGQTGVNDFEFFVTATNQSQGITYTNDFSFTGTLGNATPEIHGNFTTAGPTPADDPAVFGTSDGALDGAPNFSMFTVFWLNYLRGFGNRSSVPGTPPTDGKIPLFKIPCSNGAYMFPFDRAYNRTQPLSSLHPPNNGPKVIRYDDEANGIITNGYNPGGGGVQGAASFAANIPYQSDTLNNGTSTEDLVLTIEEVWFSDDLSTGINVPTKTWTPTTDPTTYDSSRYPDVSWFEVVKTMPRREITSLFALDLGVNPGGSAANFRNGLNSNWNMDIFGSSALGTTSGGNSNPTAVSDFDILENCAPVFGPNILQEEIPNSAGWRNVDATQGEAGTIDTGFGINLFPPHGENYNLIQNVQTTKAAYDSGVADQTYNTGSFPGQSTHTKYNSWCGGGLKRNVFSPQSSTLVGRAGGLPSGSGSPINPGATIVATNVLSTFNSQYNFENWKNAVGGNWSEYNSFSALDAAAYPLYAWYPLGWYNQSFYNSNKIGKDAPYNAEPPTWKLRSNNFDLWQGSFAMGSSGSNYQQSFNKPGLKWAVSGSSVWNGDRVCFGGINTFTPSGNPEPAYMSIIPQKNPGATEQQNPISNFIIVLNRPLTAVRDSNHTLNIPLNNAKVEFSGGNTPSGPGPLASSGTSNPASGSYPIAFPYLPSQLTDTGAYITKDIMEMGGYNYAQADGLNFTGYVNTPIQNGISAGGATTWAPLYEFSNPNNSMTSTIFNQSSGQSGVMEGNFFENIYNRPDIGYATPGDTTNSVSNSFPSWLIDVSGTVSNSGWSTQQSSYKILEPALSPADYRIKIKLTDGGALETYKWVTFRVVNPEITYSNTNPIDSRNLQSS